jgi:N-acyl-L-homoserine lactone synthetase
MLEIVQAGQAGKTKHLFDMHRLRKRIFKDRMGWDVTITEGGLEVDQFDLPETVYLLALDDAGHVIGSWRLLPTDGPTMIRDVWPQFLTSVPMPRTIHAWETSRFGIDVPDSDSKEGLAKISRTTQELVCGLLELCLLCGITEIVTMYDLRITRLLKRVSFLPYMTSQRLPVSDIIAEVGLFKIDEAHLSRVRHAIGIEESTVTPGMLPPFLKALHVSRSMPAQEEPSYAAA